jgi:dTDP-4-amino-4,6-dideoxygalactose transaminase
MIAYLDLSKINQRFESEFQQVLKATLSDGQFILGKKLLSFEGAYATYCGANYCVGTASGLDALTLILKGYIQLGKLKKGDKVIVPANTFIATILSVLQAGLVPVLVEPDPRTYILDPEAVKFHLNTDIKAIIVVWLYGQIVHYEALNRLAKEFNCLLISDAAQAHGACHKQIRAGALTNAAAFSFYPSKNLGALGDGGAVTTSDTDLWMIIKQLRNYGSSEKYKNDLIGINSRLDDLQAAFLTIKLEALDSDNVKRREHARSYLTEITNPKIKLPLYDGSANHVFYAFVVEVENREDFTNYLNRHKIGWLIHYPIPPHKQPALHRFSKFKFPITEQIHKRVISLPISPVMSSNEIKQVIEVLNTY